MSEGGQRVMEVSDFNAIRGCPWPDFWQGQGNVDAVAAIEAARSGKSARFQGPANTAAGNPRYWDVQVSPIFGPDGKVENILSISRDITMLKEAEDRHRLLALEIGHRMKNAIAMIRSIAGQTIRGSAEADLLRATFDSRLMALSAAQDILTRSEWSDAELGEIVDGALRAHTDGTRFICDGPSLKLSSKCALALALTLHELATNATKYGALSNRDGRVYVRWSTDGSLFRLRWEEVGGPPVVAPTRRGFGSVMIGKALAAYFNGTSQLSYEPNGVVFMLDSTVEALGEG